MDSTQSLGTVLSLVQIDLYTLLFPETPTQSVRGKVRGGEKGGGRGCRETLVCIRRKEHTDSRDEGRVSQT